MEPAGIRPRQHVIGWREWITLPTLGIDHIKAKIDTGARTSTLHAFAVETYRRRGALRVRFGVHPLQRRSEPVVTCHAEVIDRRWVRDSGGHRERRYVIASEAQLAGVAWTIELTLTDRETMLFRMLLGRTALEPRFVVDPSRSYLHGALPPLVRAEPGKQD